MSMVKRIESRAICFRAHSLAALLSAERGNSTLHLDSTAPPDGGFIKCLIELRLLILYQNAAMIVFFLFMLTFSKVPS